MFLDNVTDKVYVFGINFQGLQIATTLKKRNKEVLFIDNDLNKQNKEVIFGIMCIEPSKIETTATYIIAARNPDAIQSIIQQLKQLGCKDIIVPKIEEIESLKYIMDDEDYIRCQWKVMMNYEFNLENPKTFSEKLQWLKLYDRKPEYTRMVDKYEVKKYVADLIGKEHVIPLYGVWDNVEEIDLDELPDQFILKCTHDSGTFFICKDKSNFDFDAAKKGLSESLKRNYFYESREWVYKNIKPKIIAEKYIDSLGKPDSIEYKITCFDGKAGYVTICRGIAHVSLDERTNDTYEPDFKRMPWWAYYKNSDIEWKKPEQWDQLIEFSEMLSKNIPQVRVDFYVVDGEVYFGEMTFYTWAGYIKFEPKEYDKILGDMITLPTEKYVE